MTCSRKEDSGAKAVDQVAKSLQKGNVVGGLHGPLQHLRDTKRHHPEEARKNGEINLQLWSGTLWNCREEECYTDEPY